MVDPVARLKTFQTLEAQRKSDEEAIHEENERQAGEAFQPVLAAFRTLAQAGCFIQGAFSKPRMLADDLVGKDMQSRSLWIRAQPNQEFLIEIPIPGRFTDRGKRLDAISFRVIINGTLVDKDNSNVHSFATADEAIDYALNYARSWLILPEAKEESAT